MQLLELQSSVRIARSVSRELTTRFVGAWAARHPHGTIVRRDFATNPPPFINESFTSANYTPRSQWTPEMQSAMRVSEELVSELQAADRIVMGVPVYNFNVPGSVKAYFDQITRMGVTLRYDASTRSYQGLLSGKKVLAVVPSADNYSPGQPAFGGDFCVPFLRRMWQYLGVDDVMIIPVPDQALPGDARAQVLAAAREELLTLAETW